LGPQGVFVEGQARHPVSSLEQTLELLELGARNRTVGAHEMNALSSRSHLVVTLELTTTSSSDSNSEGALLAGAEVLKSRLQLIDLAGSERVGRTEATGERLKEAQHINKSLSALGDVIAALGAAQAAGKKAAGVAASASANGSASTGAHIPYRNSKLTYLLSEALGGGSKVLMFVNASPAESSAAESICSLGFAQRCRSVALGAARRSLQPAESARYLREIALLRTQLAEAGLAPNALVQAAAEAAGTVGVPAAGLARTASSASLGSSSGAPSPAAVRPGMRPGAGPGTGALPAATRTVTALRRTAMGPG